MLLKLRTGEFDLESILFLKLRGLGKANTFLLLISAIVVLCLFRFMLYVFRYT